MDRSLYSFHSLEFKGIERSQGVATQGARLTSGYHLSELNIIKSFRYFFHLQLFKNIVFKVFLRLYYFSVVLGSWQIEKAQRFPTHRLSPHAHSLPVIVTYQSGHLLQSLNLH